MLDKGRATIAGKNGDYHYACPLDQRALEFLGINADALKEQLATGKGDGEILAWIESNKTERHTPWEIAQWSAFQEQRVPGDVESRDFFRGLHSSVAPNREDVATWADLLDLDDFASFGGKP